MAKSKTPSFSRAGAVPAHGGLQATLIASRDVTAKQRFHRRAGRQVARIDATENVIDGLKRSGYFAVRELRGQSSS